jgi:multidrug resistance efflux pump
LAEINLHNAAVRAPFSGVVTKRHTDVGAYVNVGSPVVNLIDDKTIAHGASLSSGCWRIVCYYI